MADPTFKVAVSKFQLAKKIPPGDAFWPAFNCSFANLEVTRMDLADHVWKGQPFTTWHKDNWRTSANYILGQHIGLDFDTGDERSTLINLAKDKFVSKYGSLIYTSVSHTEAEPRARVVFLLDIPIMQACNYTLAAASLLWLFGTADRQCKDSVRFWYGSKGCQMEYLENVLPLEVVKHLIAQYKDSGLQEKKRHEHVTGTADQAEVAEALRKIPPRGIDYDEWLSVLMSIHSEFGDAGRELADSWADGYPGEIDRKWKSFKPDGNPSGAITIATVFGIAKRYGWSKQVM